MIDESLNKFFWGSTLWHRKQDALAYDSLIAMLADGGLNQKVRHRIVGIQFKHEKHQNPDRPLRGSPVA